MYTKNLTRDFRLRVSEEDFDFLSRLAEQRYTSVSDTVRSIIGEYRRSLELLESLKTLSDAQKGKGLSNGDTKSNFDDLV